MKYSDSPVIVAADLSTCSTDWTSVPFTRERILRWVASSQAVAESGDERFADDGETLRLVPRDRPLKPAAVLVLLVNHAVPTVVFTQRTPHLTEHGGQISFPGGRVEPDDIDAAATALREAQEETGVAAGGIEIIGALPHYTTGTGYRITPIVGWAPAPLAYAPDPFEVSEVFEVPAAFLLDPANVRQESAMYMGRMRNYYAIPFGHRYIWGATAGMLITLSRVAAHAEGWGHVAPVTMAPDSA